jgi:hypothetical protein
MGIELYWDNDAQTVIWCEFDADWTWDEMDATMTKVKNITDSTEREIAAIIDVRRGVNLPGGILNPQAITQAKKMLRMGDGGKTAPVVVVGASPLIKTIYSTVRTMDKNGLSNVAFAETLDQARTYLKARNHSYAPPNA